MKNIYMYISDFRKRRNFDNYVKSFITLSCDVEKKWIDAVVFETFLYVLALVFIKEF